MRTVRTLGGLLEVSMGVRRQPEKLCGLLERFFDALSFPEDWGRTTEETQTSLFRLAEGLTHRGARARAFAAFLKLRENQNLTTPPLERGGCMKAFEYALLERGRLPASMRNYLADFRRRHLPANAGECAQAGKINVSFCRLAFVGLGELPRSALLRRLAKTVYAQYLLGGKCDEARQWQELVMQRGIVLSRKPVDKGGPARWLYQPMRPEAWQEVPVQPRISHKIAQPTIELTASEGLGRKTEESVTEKKLTAPMVRQVEPAKQREKLPPPPPVEKPTRNMGFEKLMRKLAMQRARRENAGNAAPGMGGVA